MPYITREDEISVLPLSRRLNNCLHRASIHTIGAFLDYPQQGDWLSIRNMGAKTAAEASDWHKMLALGNGEFQLVEKLESSAETEVSEDGDQLAADIELAALNMPLRVLTAMRAVGITSASQLIVQPDEFISDLAGIGATAYERVLSTLSQLVEHALSTFQHSEERVAPSQRFALQLTNELLVFFPFEARVLLREVLLARRAYPDAQGETFYYRLYASSVMQLALNEKILALLEQNNEGLSRKRLGEALPQHLNNTTIIEEALISLENMQRVTMAGHLIKHRYPSVIRFVRQLEDEKLKDMMLARLNGKTLEEVGQQHNVTRERVRQIIQKQLHRWNKQQRFEENEYLKWYDQYLFSKEEFTFAFGVPDSTYHYLDMISSVNQTLKKSLADLFEEEEEAPVWLRKQCERIVFKDYLTLDGIRVKKERAALCRHFVKQRCFALTAYDDFMQQYHEFLAELGLQDQQSLIIESRTYENKLNGADYVLWNQWRRFRYYNIHARDYTELLATLNLHQYENTEISSLKPFREHPELMKEYDIRDEYELHNLLKKIWPPDDRSVVFRKMPTIEIGSINRNNQVLNLLLQYAPISAEDLSDHYEELYGIKATTVRANYLKDFDEYYYEGMYSIEADNLPYEHFSYLKDQLSADYYFIPDIKRCYLKAYPDANVEDINPYTLKTLGFKVFSSYVLKDVYATATEYFHRLLTDDDIVDARNFDKSMFNLGSYSGELGRLRAARDIVEYEPHQYINIRRLQHFGVSKDQLNAYCSAVWNAVDSGALFTVASLRKSGFAHALDDLGFEEWFYGSIILEDREHFSYQRIGGTRIFKAGQSTNLMDELLHLLVGYSGKMDVYDLRDCLEDDYGIILSRDKLIELVRETDMYYDRIMEAVYIDYDTYFEEV